MAKAVARVLAALTLPALPACAGGVGDDAGRPALNAPGAAAESRLGRPPWAEPGAPSSRPAATQEDAAADRGGGPFPAAGPPPTAARPIRPAAREPGPVDLTTRFPWPAAWTLATAAELGARGGGVPSEGALLAQLPAPGPSLPTPRAPEPLPPRRGAPAPDEPAAPAPPPVGAGASDPALSAAPARPDEPEVEAREQLLVEAGGLLLPAGTLQIEPSVDYTFASSDRVAITGFSVFEAIVIGQIQVDDLERNIVTGALDLRYGLTDRLQLAVRVPGVYRTETELVAVGTENEEELSTDGVGLGDVEASVSWQPPLPVGPWPDVILRVEAGFPTGKNAFEIDTDEIELESGATRLVLEETPTGSGFYSVGLGTTLVYRTDPVVYFLGGGYTFNLERDVGGDFGDVDPGDTVEWFTGLSLGVNERVALNASFVHQLTDETEQNGSRSPGTAINDARIVLGSSFALTPSASLLASAAAGLTDESPDFQFTVRLPISFDLF